MKIINLTRDSDIYTSNVYFLLGDRNRMDDVNALIDVGRDPLIVEKISRLNTGAGKQKVEKVVLTHSHYDHADLLPAIKAEFDPVAYAFHSFDGINHTLKDGQTLRLADRWFEVIHIPGHTGDSICLYSEQDGILFSGDTSLSITATNGSYQKDFVEALRKITRRDIKKIYPGHSEPITDNVKRMLYVSLDNVRKSRIFYDWR